MNRKATNLRTITSLIVSLAFSLLFSSCKEDEVYPNIEEGKYFLEIYDSKGKLVLTREGDAFHLESAQSIRMDDPHFQQGEPLETFAYLSLSTFEEINKPGIFKIETDALVAFIEQHWYHSDGDWGYKGVDGFLSIDEVYTNKLRGHFNVKMQICSPDEGTSCREISGVQYQPNPLWGGDITIKGYFISQER